MSNQKLKQERQNIRADAGSNYHAAALWERISRSGQKSRAERRLLVTALREMYPQVVPSLIRDHGGLRQLPRAKSKLSGKVSKVDQAVGVRTGANGVFEHEWHETFW